MKLQLNQSERALCPQCGGTLKGIANIEHTDLAVWFHSWNSYEPSALATECVIVNPNRISLYCPDCDFKLPELDGVEVVPFNIWGENPTYPRSDWQHEVVEGNTNRGYWDYVDERRRSE